MRLDLTAIISLADSQTLPEAQIVDEESDEEAEPDTVQTQEMQTSPKKATKTAETKSKRPTAKSSRNRSKFAGDACECGASFTCL